MKIFEVAEQLSLFVQDSWSGKTSREHSQAASPKGKTSGSSSKKYAELVAVPYMSLDLTPGAGNLLDESYWEILSPWRGESLILNTGPAPRSAVGVSSLSQILQENVPKKYYLSPKACLGILRRAWERGKELPKMLKRALMIQSGLVRPDGQPTKLKAYHINQRDEGIDLHGVSGALMATSNMQMQTFVTQEAGYNGTDTEVSVICLNDQGGQRMDVSKDITGTLRAQMDGHPPLVYENHGIDARYTGPLSVSPTLSARCGTGGNNIPLVEQEPVYCIVGNTIDRQPQNGGNGCGWQEDIAYTLTATDHHAVFSRQRVDVFKDDEIASTQSARQHKDATDLVVQQAVFGQSQFGNYAEGCATLRAQGGDNGGGSENLVAEEYAANTMLIRRLIPLECERLQGFPDGWTDIPSASDAARYKALGNSVAIPCVEYIMHGIALALKAA